MVRGARRNRCNMSGRFTISGLTACPMTLRRVFSTPVRRRMETRRRSCSTKPSGIIRLSCRTRRACSRTMSGSSASILVQSRQGASLRPRCRGMVLLPTD
ncbi:hypothetical protein BN1723_019073 [Verticillium longisporum]|uniref:Uncharacterized protein n=1 Tax=Verticillium longisporum TaxID=100787 RepID=A0A0G4N8J8_VERLO|nr:hypothetical protein BN1723_019073 [Verticillium longisporum]